MPRTSKKSTFMAVLISFWGAAVAIWVASSQATQTNPHANVLGLGGAITEIVYALGEGDRLVARDSTSTYPPEAEKLPDVGYVRALSPEGVLSVSPGLIVAEDGAGPPEAIAVLESASIPFVNVPEEHSAEGIAEKIRIVGHALGVDSRAEALANDVTAKITEATEAAETRAGDNRKTVMFVMSAQGGRIMASGTNTAADAIITLAGGVNAFVAFEGYKPVTDEAIGLAAPDVILMMDRGGDHSVAGEVLFNLPALKPTPAAKSEAIVHMNGLYMLGFGPRTADAIADLSAQLYPQ
ncbi:MAG: ABC transporter substrate-binding protein [Roseovarius sp.]|nr:ABC transporter substrate-binding protein [Roseovarius sp.]